MKKNFLKRIVSVTACTAVLTTAVLASGCAVSYPYGTDGGADTGVGIVQPFGIGTHDEE